MDNQSTGFFINEQEVRNGHIIKSVYCSSSKRKFLMYHLVVWNKQEKQWWAFHVGDGRVPDEDRNSGDSSLKVLLRMRYKQTIMKRLP